MPWTIGIDEAGYGPNLGPLVQAAVALRLPDGDEAGWATLRPVVRRTADADDGRLLLDDSKAVHRGPNGLSRLERGVRSCLLRNEATVGRVVEAAVAPAWAREELAREHWFAAADATPLTYARDGAGCERTAFECRMEEAGLDVRIAAPHAAVVCAPRFNRIVDESDSKATVLARGLVELLQSAYAALPADGEPIAVTCDKLGGRNFYSSLVQSSFPAGWVTAERESADESRYGVVGLERPVAVVFRPRADGASAAVALASMLCKYLREVCMIQFNRFWAGRVPGLVSTAGYPGDARRFYDSIRAARLELGLDDDRIWRKR